MPKNNQLVNGTSDAAIAVAVSPHILTSYFIVFNAIKVP